MFARLSHDVLHEEWKILHIKNVYTYTRSSTGNIPSAKRMENIRTIDVFAPTMRIFCQLFHCLENTFSFITSNFFCTNATYMPTALTKRPSPSSFERQPSPYFLSVILVLFSPFGIAWPIQAAQRVSLSPLQFFSLLVLSPSFSSHCRNYCIRFPFHRSHTR